MIAAPFEVLKQDKLKSVTAVVVTFDHLLSTACVPFSHGSGAAVRFRELQQSFVIRALRVTPLFGPVPII